MHRPFSRFLLFLLGLTLLGAAVSAAEPGHNFGIWEREIAAFEAKDRAAPPPKHGLLFIGSSTIRLWTTLAADYPGYPVINRGFGGSQIVDVTHFADRIVFPYEPRAIFLRSATNDIHAGKSAAQVFADFREFVDVVRARAPETEIYYISLCPSIARWSEAQPDLESNRLVAAYAKTAPHVHYIETWTMSLDAKGEPRPELFRDDKLHLNADGYKILAELVRPAVTEAGK